MENAWRRIRKGFPSEARMVARILPQFLDDFFPLQDVMNKVIGEFLSNQQPYPQFMATVVYKASATFWVHNFLDILYKGMVDSTINKLVTLMSFLTHKTLIFIRSSSEHKLR